MVIEQVTDGFAKAVSFNGTGGVISASGSSSAGQQHQGATLAIQSKTSMQIPRSKSIDLDFVLRYKRFSPVNSGNLDVAERDTLCHGVTASRTAY